VPPPETTAGLNVADPTEPANPPSDKATSPVNPFSDPTETVYPAALPALTVCADGVTPRLKSGGCEMTIDAVAVWVVVPLVPLIVSGYVPGAAVAGVVTVSRDVPAAETTAGLNVAVQSDDGNPLSESATSDVKPFTPATVTV
jgi:phage baseplate assembly protein gpV